MIINLIALWIICTIVFTLWVNREVKGAYSPMPWKLCGLIPIFLFAPALVVTELVFIGYDFFVRGITPNERIRIYRAEDLWLSGAE